MISLNKAQQKGNKHISAAEAARERAVPDMIGNTKIAGARAEKGHRSEKIATENAHYRGSARGAAGSRSTDSVVTESGETDSGEIRGRFGYMQYIHGFIGCVLLVLALIHIPFPEPLAWLPFSAAAVLALITMKSEISMAISRVLAIFTAGMMFFFFALFFLAVPGLEADWYMTQYGWAAVSLILSAFLMIPVLSDYSCRLKADCMEARAARRTAFFSVPSDVHPESR